jgi:hypothetical protein
MPFRPLLILLPLSHSTISSARNSSLSFLRTFTSVLLGFLAAVLVDVPESSHCKDSSASNGLVVGIWPDAEADLAVPRSRAGDPSSSA